ncbi:MAG TPA: nitroreductase family protein [bacterium]|nr:nitroreductase family protein [bacterium]
MSVLDVIKLRKSVRAYDKEKQVSDESLLKILEAARLAPSAKNVQEWKFMVVKDRKILKDLVPACKEQKFVGDCSCVIAACSNETEYVMTCGQAAYVVDLSIAVAHMSLVAAELGIGSCWLGAFHEDRVKGVLNIPSEYRVVALLTLGYPAGRPLSQIVTTNRKELKEIVCYDKWSF